MENILNRIKKIAENEGITITAFEDRIGASKGVLSRAIRKDTDIQVKWLTKIVENFPEYDPRWLISGELPMKREFKKDVTEPQVEYITNGRKTKSAIVEDQLVPLYNLEATAGIVNLFADASQFTPVDFIRIPNLPKSDGAIYVTGDSMYPLLKSGDIVIYKTITPLLENIFFGEMYLISIRLDGDEITTVKWIHRSDLGPDYIKLVSQNQHHQPKDVHISSVFAIALIKASVRINSMS